MVASPSVPTPPRDDIVFVISSSSYRAARLMVELWADVYEDELERPVFSRADGTFATDKQGRRYVALPLTEDGLSWMLKVLRATMAKRDAAAKAETKM